MSDRQQHKKTPTASIAWMNQAYDTSSTSSSPTTRHADSPTFSVNNTSTITSLDSFDRPESPTLPPEGELSKPTSATAYNYIDTNMPPLAAYYQTMDKVHQDPPLPPAPLGQPYNDSTRHHHHHHHSNHYHRKTSSRRPAHLSDHTAAAIELSVSPNVPPAPAAGMYWSRAITYGRSPSRPLRAHSANLIGEQLYVFGGCDMKTCFNSLHVLDMDTLTWTKPRTNGTIPPPCRAHSATTVERDSSSGKKSFSLYVFGGGDGPNYFNDLYALNVDTLSWTKPLCEGEPPSPRRAHTTCIWQQKIIVVGGGDGARALADVHSLDVSDPQALKWSKLNTEGSPPIARGYHTSNLVKDKLIVYGGSDGHECFSDVYILDLVTNRWNQIDLDRAVPRLAHSATQVGSYVFVIGGHDGTRYSNEVLLLNLVTMSWETRKIYGGAPSARGYHTSVLHDSRLYILGGYDGRNVFEDVFILELSACAYLPQITNFEIDV